MSQERFEIGDLVWFQANGQEGHPGVVSQPVSEASGGHVLVCRSGQIIGISVTLDDIAIMDKRRDGYVRLAFNLLALGNHVIKKKVLPHR